MTIGVPYPRPESKSTRKIPVTTTPVDADARGYFPGDIFINESTGAEWIITLAGAVVQISGGGAGAAIGANQVPYGTGASIAGSPHLTWDPTGSALYLYDTSGLSMVEIDALGPGGPRDLVLRDNAGFGYIAIQTRAGKRLSIWNDEAEQSFFSIDGKSANKRVRFGGGTNVATTTRLEYSYVTSLLTGYSSDNNKTWELNIGTGAPLSFATLAAASAAGLIHADGQTAFIANVLKPTEMAGGTGALCIWYTAGPGGAGWYTTLNVLATV